MILKEIKGVHYTPSTTPALECLSVLIFGLNCSKLSRPYSVVDGCVQLHQRSEMHQVLWQMGAGSSNVLPSPLQCTPPDSTSRGARRDA